MSEREKAYLFDVQTALEEIDQFLREIASFQDSQTNLLVRRAVERELTIIGEAVNRLLARNPGFPITSARQIVRFRNRITNEYDAVDDVNVWAILKNHLPVLRQEVAGLLTE